MRRHDSCEGTKKIGLRGQWRGHYIAREYKRKEKPASTPLTVDDSSLIPFWLSQPRHVFCFPCRVLCRVAEASAAATLQLTAGTVPRRAFLSRTPRVDTYQYGTQCLSLAFDLAMPFEARIIPLMYASFPRVSVNSTWYAASHSQLHRGCPGHERNELYAPHSL